MKNYVLCMVILLFVSLPASGQVEIPAEGFFSVGISTAKVTTSELADIAMPNRGVFASIRKYESTILELSWDTFGYLEVTEGQFGDLWTYNLMMFAGPRFYFRHPKNLSGVFAGIGIGGGLKSMQMEWEYMGMSLGTETTEYLALTGMVCLGFDVMLTRNFGLEAAYYRSAELLSADNFRYRQLTLGLNMSIPE